MEKKETGLYDIGQVEKMHRIADVAVRTRGTGLEDAFLLRLLARGALVLKDVENVEFEVLDLPFKPSPRLVRAVRATVAQPVGADDSKRPERCSAGPSLGQRRGQGSEYRIFVSVMSCALMLSAVVRARVPLYQLEDQGL